MTIRVDKTVALADAVTAVSWQSKLCWADDWMELTWCYWWFLIYAHM